MFILRSAFWLAAAFAVIAPMAGTDIGEVGHSAGERLKQESTGLVSAALAKGTCTSIECEVGRAAVSGLLDASPTRSSIQPMQDVSSVGPAPVPPPRPDWAG